MVQAGEEERRQIRAFLEENYLFGAATTLGDGDSFLDGGILDSTGVLELIGFLGDRYGITVEDREVTPENLDSIDRIVAYLARKRNGGAPPDGRVQR